MKLVQWRCGKPIFFIKNKTANTGKYFINKLVPQKPLEAMQQTIACLCPGKL